MFQITVSLYSSYTCHTYVVHGYMYSTTNQWYLPKCVYTGTGTPDIKVGRDSNGKAYISIARGSYTGVRVHNMTRGYYTSVADTYDPWTITENDAVENSVTPPVSKVWHSTNDGAGSGLDADLLDGVQSSSFLRSDATDTATRINSPIFSGNISTSGDGQNNYPFRLTSDYNSYMVAAASNTWGLFWAGNVNARYGTNGNGGPGNIWSNSANPNEFCFVGGDSTAWTVQGSSGDTWQKGTARTADQGILWGASNDGSGSGLDADLLDGYNAEETAVNNSIVKRDGTATIKVNGINITSSIPNDTDNSGTVNSSDALNMAKGKRGTAAGMRTPSIGVESSGAGIYLRKKSALEEAVSVDGSGEIVITGGAESGNTETTHHKHATSWTYGQITNYISGTGGYVRNYYTGSSASTDAVALTSVDVSGNFIAKGNVTAYGTVSDIRLKENIKVIPNALEKVQKLRGVTFNYKEDNNRSTGLIAQELQEILPEVVYETENIDTQEKHYAVRYGNITGLLVEAIKELKSEVDDLKTQLSQKEN